MFVFTMIRRRWWIAFLLLLSGCVDGEITTKFLKDGSGTVVLKFAPLESSEGTMTSVSDCVEMLDNDANTWDKISISEAGSLGNPNSKAACVYTYQFDELTEVKYLYDKIGLLDIEKLYLDEDNFYLTASIADCTPSASDSEGSIFLSLELPGQITSNNADKVIGNRLTWDLDSIGCSQVVAESKLQLAEPKSAVEDEPIKPTPTSDISIENPPSIAPVEADQPKKEGVVNSVVIWTTIGASVATIIATVIAFSESRKRP